MSLTHVNSTIAYTWTFTILSVFLHVNDDDENSDDDDDDDDDD